MGYIEKTLAEEEALIAKARFHWLYHVFAYGALVLFIAAAAYIYAEFQAPWFAAMVGVVGLITIPPCHDPDMDDRDRSDQRAGYP